MLPLMWASRLCSCLGVLFVSLRLLPKCSLIPSTCGPPLPVVASRGRRNLWINRVLASGFVNLTISSFFLVTLSLMPMAMCPSVLETLPVVGSSWNRLLVLKYRIASVVSRP